MTTTWAELAGKLDDRIMSAIKEFGFEAPTPVQAACIPLMLERKDVVAEAVTGSGKTLAYLVPLIQTILNVEKEEKSLRNDAVYAVVILPTRELAAQVYSVLGTFLKHMPSISSALLTSGKNRNISDQTRRIGSGATHILVSTPGRLATFFDVSGEANLLRKVKQLELLVLDEADRLLELGFYETLQRIITSLPKQRRTSLFSATQTGDLEQLVRAGLRNPVRVTVRDRPTAPKRKSQTEATAKSEQMEVDEPNENRSNAATKTSKQNEGKAATDGSRTPTSLRSFYTVMERDAKLPFIEAFIRHHAEAKVLIFTATCLCATFVHAMLRAAFRRRAEYILRLHRKTHSKRDAVLKRFAAARRGAVLVCTDVLARGIDVPDVDWVIQMDAPAQARTYVHRAGRTARQGRSGCSLLMLTPSENAYLRFLNINQQVTLASFEPDFQLPSQATADDGSVSVGILERCARLVRDDPLIRMRAIRAFTSYVRFYTKHEAHLIFRVRDLNVDALARSFGLSHIPKMPELTFWKSQARTANTDSAKKQKDDSVRKTATEGEKDASKEVGKPTGTAAVRFRNKNDARTYECLLKHFDEKRKRAEKRMTQASWSRSHPRNKRERKATDAKAESKQQTTQPPVSANANGGRQKSAK